MVPDIENALRFCPNLPTLSGVALRIVEMGRDPDVEINAVATVLSHDPALAAKLIRIANSPLYAQRRKLSNLRQALSFLGLDGAMTLALSFSLASSLGSSTALRPRDLERYWRRALLTALGARILGEELDLLPLEELFLAGLLQDLGMLALGTVLPGYAGVVAAASDHQDLLQRERQRFGTDHSEAGAWLLEHWGLPEYLYTAARLSHAPPATALAADSARFVGCGAVANRLAAVYLDAEPEAATTAVADAAEEHLGLPKARLQKVLARFAETVPETESVFEVSLLTPEQVAGITDQARELLALRSFRLIRSAAESQDRASQLEQERNKLQEAAKRDPLTGLHNRRHFERALEQAFDEASAQGTPLSLGFLDLDRFKRINDLYGHQVGDAALVSAADAIAAQVRQDDQVVRYGGEEFVVLLPGVDATAARAAFERIRAAIERLEHPLEDGTALRFTVSAGVVTCTRQSGFRSAQELLQAADRALYRAKHGGRNRVELVERLPPSSAANL